MIASICATPITWPQAGVSCVLIVCICSIFYRIVRGLLG